MQNFQRNSQRTFAYSPCIHVDYLWFTPAFQKIILVVIKYVTVCVMPCNEFLHGGLSRLVSHPGCIPNLAQSWQLFSLDVDFIAFSRKQRPSSGMKYKLGLQKGLMICGLDLDPDVLSFGFALDLALTPLRGLILTGSWLFWTDVSSRVYFYFSLASSLGFGLISLGHDYFF